MEPVNNDRSIPAEVLARFQPLADELEIELLERYATIRFTDGEEWDDVVAMWWDGAGGDDLVVLRSDGAATKFRSAYPTGIDRGDLNTVTATVREVPLVIRPLEPVEGDEQ